MAPNAGLPSGTPVVATDTARRNENAMNRHSEDQTSDPAAGAYPIEPSFRHFAESLADLVWSTRPDGHADYFNRRFLEYLGCTLEELVGWTWAEMIHPDDAPGVRRAWERAFTTGGEYDVDFRVRRHDGVYRWHHSHGSPMRDEAGRITRWFGTCTDVDDRRSDEEALRRYEQRFARFMEHLPGLAWIKDSEGRYVYANDDAIRAFGVTREELYGRTDAEIFPPETVAAFRAHDRQALETGAGIRVIETLEHPDGTIHHSIVSKFPIPGADVESVLVGGMAIDITERLEMEAALKEADRRKDEFLATLAHELRNPLAPLRNGLQVMKLARADDNVVEESRAMMERQLEQMVRLIDDLLDVSRISRGKITLQRQRVELAAVVRQAVETSRPLIDASRHDLTITGPPEPIYVDADVTRLAQVFANLLNNAAKYTEPGGHIAVRIERHGGEAVVAVRDSGVGIPAYMLPELFEMFTQVDRSLERSQGGLGIGLSLVKRLVEMHGGSVAARSDGHGMGSEFIVRLPVVPVLAAPGRDIAGAPQAGGLSRRRVLVVDDNKDSAFSLAMMLRFMGNETRTAHDGLEALELVPVFQPHLVLLDIGMPRLDGYETARRIREQPWGKSVALVALTGWGQSEDRRRSEEAGFDFHIVKPAEPATLEKLLAGLKGETA